MLVKQGSHTTYPQKKSKITKGPSIEKKKLYKSLCENDLKTPIPRKEQNYKVSFYWEEKTI